MMDAVTRLTPAIRVDSHLKRVAATISTPVPAPEWLVLFLIDRAPNLDYNFCHSSFLGQ